MIALKFQHIRDINALLFEKDTFDAFLLLEASLIGEYALTLEQLPASGSSIPYGKIRPVLEASLPSLSDPLRGRITLKASDSYMQSLVRNPGFTGDPDMISSLVLTFRIENDSLSAMTGISYRTFTPDKSMDRLWDQAIQKAFDHMNISYELL
ncbi:MAG: DUF5721 family protein [Lachnospiraceae bacterium]|nr:DUF5721 family protein [Lachnospiraceae bacterium]